jgi:hypothetical protein
MTTIMMRLPFDSLRVGDVVRVTAGSLAGSYATVPAVSYSVDEGVSAVVQFRDGFRSVYPVAGLHRVGRRTTMGDFHARGAPLRLPRFD